MTQQDDTFTGGQTDGAVAANHETQQLSPVLVGPATGAERNTIRLLLRPVACWRVDDFRFDFDSSFVRPQIDRDMALLAKVVRAHPGAPASVFGHADPVGRDDYNKQLSGRRAAAIYGMLTRNTDVWEDLYSQTGKFASALPSDKWKLKAVQEILQDLGFPAGPIDGEMGSQTREAVRAYQRDRGLGVDGHPGPQTRARLFLDYMDRHCRDDAGNPFKMARTDFLGQGADPAGKGDYQGCSEFNPVLMFSQEENERFQQARDHTERNAANAPNRRVTIFLFRPPGGAAGHLPCPRAKEPIAGCQNRFWSDHRQRRAFREERRLQEQTRDTFACRFYDRIAGASPCERVVRWTTLRIRLFDPWKKPIPHAPYRLTVGQQRSEGMADENGWLEERAMEVPDQCLVDWGRPAEAGQPTSYIYEGELYLNLQEGNEEEEALRRLHNLGYRSSPTLADSIKAFQRDYGRSETGNLADVKGDVWQWHDNCEPEPLSSPESAGAVP